MLIKEVSPQCTTQGNYGYGWSDTGAQRKAKQNKNAFSTVFLERQFIKTSRLFKHNSLQIWKLRKLVFILCGILDNLTFHNIFAAPAN